MPASGVDEIADELYSLSPREFTVARDSRAAEARKAGDKDAARRIRRLRRPTVSAWLANQLVRQHRDEVGPLLELGAALREATATLSGPQLRQLSRQRHEVVQALVRQARRLAADTGQPVSEDAARGLEDTLNAALADADAGEQLLAGRLTDVLHHSGYGPATDAAPAPASTGRAPADAAKKSPAATSPSQRRRAERRDRLRRDLAEAWAAARTAADARSAADDEATRAAGEADSAQRRVDELRAELVSAEDQLGRARAARDESSSARKIAHERADRATRHVTELQRELDET